MGPDFCRFIRRTGCGKLCIPCIYDSQGKPSWNCPTCGVRDDMGSKEEELIRRAKSLKVRAAEVPLGPLQDLVEDASKQLSPSHHITIEALDTVAQLGASKAVSQEMTQQFMAMMGGPRTNPYGMPTTTFRKIAAVAGLEAVVASECVAAGCHGCCSGKLFTGKDFQLPHDPVY
jgi:hypothetical protein